MPNIMTVGYLVEGPTDERFLASVIKRTFEDIALLCDSEIQVYDPVLINSSKTTFIETVVDAANQAAKIGIVVLCIHCDADNSTANFAIHNKINPAIEELNRVELEKCDNIAPIVPVYMTESWLLADVDLLKEEIGTEKSNQDLQLTRIPENIADPKETIRTALRLAQEHLPQRRTRLKINDLYQPIGQKVSIERLKTIQSYTQFWEDVRQSFIKANYLH